MLHKLAESLMISPLHVARGRQGSFSMLLDMGASPLLVRDLYTLLLPLVSLPLPELPAAGGA